MKLPGAVRIHQVILGLAVVAGLVLALYAFSISRPLEFGDDAYLIKRGSSVSDIAQDLIDRGVLSEPYSLKLHVRIKKVGHLIQAGEYHFPDGISLIEFVNRLVTGRGHTEIRITIIEGWTFRQMRRVINNAPSLEKTTADWTDQQIMEKLGHPELHPEGQFFPDTYRYRRDDSDLSIYRKSFRLMRRKLDNAWAQRSPDIQVKDRYQALILASIIEKEARIHDEKPLIAGVFDNRLRRGMRLQADPTVVYGMGDEYTGRIRKKHLKSDTPYNTYTRGGLTPTPICLPGEKSILAAVKPAKTKSLYFVASEGGKHQFSETLKEHNAAVKKYILNK